MNVSDEIEWFILKIKKILTYYIEMQNLKIPSYNESLDDDSQKENAKKKSACRFII